MPKKRSEWKDPNRPKRPISAFLAFSKEKYQEVKKEQPDFNPQEVGREMGVRWKALTPEEKRRYEELACADRMRYEVEMLEYIPTSHEELSDPEEEKQRKKSLARKAKSQRDPLLPQRAQTSWFFFSSEKRPLLKQEFPNIRITEMSKKISEMWRAMDNEAKKPYEERAQRDKERYQQAMEAYESEEEKKKNVKKSKISPETVDATLVEITPAPPDDET
eukprot:TRINITY_DN3390_c0_g1_i2.p1 TRINITY_DN3390_c0_g1~~TRINITY_DN3390_c0_g1_i2.p1  ORF type:complete len:219 (+),score=39.51 TRINITY_DN3390_c0_g1_i2:73-729(+)